MFQKPFVLKFLRITKKCSAACAIVFSVVLLTSFYFQSTQKRNELEIKRQQLLQKIAETNKKLNSTKQIQQNATEDLETLQDRIETREALINTLEEELSATDSIVWRTEEMIEALQEDYTQLRSEYAQLMQRAYRAKIPTSVLYYMLSSKDFAESYRRWQYFRIYDRFRKRQVSLIGKTQQSLAEKIAFLKAQKTQKEQFLTENEHQQTMLDAERVQKDGLVQKLKSEAERLSSELKTQEKQTANINNAIERLIVAEIEAKKQANAERQRKAREEAKRLERERKKWKKQAEDLPVAPKKEEIIIESSENLALSGNFRSNKGKLPAPATGKIVRGFGRQQVSDKVTAVNNGIDIQTNSQAEVRAVFNGTVSLVQNIGGIGTVVLVQHGNYYTVYSGLAAANVKKGDKISTRQRIGSAGVNPISGASELHFEVWLEKTQLDPAAWIAK